MEKKRVLGLDAVCFLVETVCGRLHLPLTPLTLPLTCLLNQASSLKVRKMIGDKPWTVKKGRVLFCAADGFLELCSKYAVWYRGMMFLGQSRCRINMLRLNILTKPMPQCIWYCASL